MRKHIPQWQPQVGDEELNELSSVIESNWITEAGKCAELEGHIRDVLGVPYVALCTSGTAALYMGLLSLGIGQGDEVIIPDFTFIADANAVASTGARPVLVDVTANLTLDLLKLEDALTPATKAILYVHLNGRHGRLEEIIKTARRHNIVVIEDSAQAIGVTINGRSAGSIGAAGCFSLATTKIITSGQGGFVVTRDKDCYERLLSLKDQGRPVRSWNHFPDFGLNFKFTDLQAAVACAQFKKLDGRIKRMKEIYRLYEQGLAGCPGINSPGHNLEAGELPWFIDILTDDRDGLAEHLKTKGIETRPFYPPIHTQVQYKAEGDFSVTERASRTGLWLPSGLGLTDEEIEYICQEIYNYV